MFDNEKKRNISITIDPLIVDAMKKAARKEYRSLSSLTEILYRNYLKELKKGKQTEIK